MTQSSYKEIANIIGDEKSFVLTTHINPDGDGLGCEYALYHHLKSIQKHVRIINTSKLPENYSFLNADLIFEQYNSELHDEIISSSAVILCVDMNDSRRLNTMEPIVLRSTAKKIVIDHHLHPKEFADHYLIDSETCAVGEILYNLFSEFGVQKFSYDTSLGLYIAIMTDTGSFRFPRTTSKVHAITSELMRAGFQPEIIYQKIFDEYPIGRTKLLGKILACMESFCDGKATMLHVTQSMLSETQTIEEDIENIVNFGLSIGGVLVTALLVELQNEIKLSFRSRGDIDVSKVARLFGGGGHKNAAGARELNEPLEVVESKIKKTIEELLIEMK